MKKIIFLVFALLALCACGTEEPAEQTKPIQKEELAESVSEEEVPPEEPKEEIDPIKKAALAEIRGMWVDKVLSSWRTSGFSAVPNNISFLEDGVFSYNFTITRGNQIVSFPAKGIITYQNMDSFAVENQSKHILATWGCDGILPSGARYFITLEKVVFFDANFEFLGEIILEENSYFHLWPISVAETPDGGYIIPVCKIPKDNSTPSGIGTLLSYDANFEFIEETGDVPIYYESFEKASLPAFCEESFIYLYKNAPYLSSIYCYNLEDLSAYQVLPESGKYFDENRYITFVSGQKIDAENPNSAVYHLALIKEDNNIINYMELSEDFLFDGENSVAEISKNGNIATVFDDYYHRSITLNFKNKTAESEYVFLEEHLSEAFDVSADKIYSLHTTSETSGGDAIGYSVVLKNNLTGELKYLFDGGSGIFCGFLKNDDIYYQTLEDLKIYSPETSELIFDISNKFSLNADSYKGDYRCLLAFRRDPDTYHITVLYWEGSAQSISEPSTKFPTPVYKIAFLDDYGNMLKNYESNIPVAIGMYMWPQDAVIYYHNDKYTVTSLGFKEDKGINFTFDAEKEEFSEPRNNR